MPKPFHSQLTPAIRCLHVFVLVGFAVAQPLYDLLSKNAGFFTARHAAADEIMLVVAVVSVLIPVLLLSLVVLARLLGRPSGGILYALVLVALVALICLPLLNRAALPAPLVLGLAGLASSLAVYAYFRYTVARQFVTLLSPAIVVFPLLFLLASPIRDFIVPTAEGEPASTASRKQSSAPPTTVMVLLDELPMTSLLNRRRVIDEDHFPNFAALADDAYLFRDTITVSDNTLTAIPAILTGNYPEAGLSATTKDHPQNLFTLLEDLYEFNVIESVTELCPRRLCPSAAAGRERLARYESLLSDLSAVYLHLIVPEKYRDHLPDISNQWKDFHWHDARTLDNQALHQRAVKETRADRAGKFDRFIESIERNTEPTLHFLHILLPHAPYIHLPSGKVYSLPKRVAGLEKGRWLDDTHATQEAYQRHLLQLAFVDAQIGKLTKRLKRLGMYESALFVIAADHGVSFRSSIARRRLSEDNYEDIAPVPLIMKLPDQDRGRISDRHAETVDILPSIADVVGIQPPQAMDGRSLFSREAPSTDPRRVFFEHAERTLVIDEEAFDSRKKAALRLKHSLLDDSGHGLYEFGDVDVTARPLDDFKILDETPPAAELDQAFLYDDVDPRDPFVPNRISGRIHIPQGLRQRDQVGIAVNNTLWAVTAPHDVDESSARFSVMVPESAFVAGQNDVQVFLARTREQSGVALVPTVSNTPDAGNRYQLTDSDTGGDRLLGPDGASIPIDSDAIEGWLDGVHRRGDLIQFYGWAGDIDDGRPAQHVLIFKDGHFVHAGNPEVTRSDVVTHFGDENLSRSGFHYTLPASLFDGDTETVRLFAISHDGQASELQYFEDFEWKRKS